jgi:hypothetical protein
LASLTTIQNKRDRPIVLKQDAHVRAELAGFDSHAPPPEAFDDQLIRLTGGLRWGSPIKARAPALSEIGQESKLRHEEDRPAHVSQRHVHLAVRIVEHPERSDFLHHVLHVNFSVTFGDAQQDEHAGVDLSDDPGVNFN